MTYGNVLPGVPQPSAAERRNGAGTFTGQWVAKAQPLVTGRDIWRLKGIASGWNSGRPLGCGNDHGCIGNVWVFGGQGVDSAGTTGTC